MYLFLAVLGLYCWVDVNSSCDEMGATLLQWEASHCGGFSCCGAWALGHRPSVDVVCGLSCSYQGLQHRFNTVTHGLSCSAGSGIFPHQRLNPCLLHWQADSLPLSHHGSSVRGYSTHGRCLCMTREFTLWCQTTQVWMWLWHLVVLREKRQVP